MRMEVQGLILAGSSWDLAAPFACGMLVWRKGKPIVIGWGKKEKILCCSPLCQEEASFTYYYYGKFICTRVHGEMQVT